MTKDMSAVNRPLSLPHTADARMEI